MSQAIAVKVADSGHVTIDLPGGPEALEAAADRLEQAGIPPSAYEVSLLCAALMRRIAGLDRALRREMERPDA